MKKLSLIIATVIGAYTIAICQCTTSYSFMASSDTVSFTNLSSVSYAHYFWNFGDGTGSNEVSPVHAFPGTGNYIVTLFAKDTVSNCSSYYEQWVSVLKPAGVCHPWISDSIFTSGGRDSLLVYDSSSNCAKYVIGYGGGVTCWQPYAPTPLPTAAFRVVCFAVYFDTTNLQDSAEAFKTAYHNYSSSHNYGDSSANFEFIVTAKNASYEKILFTAMNKNAVSYKWFLYNNIGEDTVVSISDTFSESYSLPFICGLSTVGLAIQASTGYRDTIYQNIMPGDSIGVGAASSINNLKNATAQVVAYPNPSNGNFTLIDNEQLTMDNKKESIEIYNTLGQLVYSKLSIVHFPLLIDLTSQPNGIYLYRVLTTNGDLVGEGKVVVQH